MRSKSIMFLSILEFFRIMFFIVFIMTVICKNEASNADAEIENVCVFLSPFSVNYMGMSDPLNRKLGMSFFILQISSYKCNHLKAFLLVLSLGKNLKIGVIINKH